MKLLVIIFVSIIAITSSTLIESHGEFVMKKQEIKVPDQPEPYVFDNVIEKKNKAVDLGKGLLATETQFPWVADMVAQYGMFPITCISSLISNKWLLGAKSCVAGQVDSLRVMLGSPNRQGKRLTFYSDLFVWIEYVDGHPADHPYIAVFRLSQTVPFSSTISPIRLPSRSQKDLTYDGFVVTGAGFGLHQSNDLVWGDYFVKPLSVCKETTSETNFDLCIEASDTPKSNVNLEAGSASVYYEYGIATLISVNAMETGTNRQLSHRIGPFLDFISSTTGIPIRN